MVPRKLSGIYKDDLKQPVESIDNKQMGEILYFRQRNHIQSLEIIADVKYQRNVAINQQVRK